jgi:hypothetical protein
MPLYYFTVIHGHEEREHLEGLDFPNDKAAWEEATIACGEMLREADGNLQPGTDWVVVVKRESGELVYRLLVSAEAYDKK